MVPGLAMLVDRYGVMVFGSRWMKSKIPWPPASVPEMKSDHATGLWGGIEVPREENPPESASFSNDGSRPSSIILAVSS